MTIFRVLSYFGNVIFPKTLQWYTHSLRWSLEHRRFVLGVFFLTLVLTTILFIIIPKGFIPSEDSNEIFGYTEADTSVSFTEMTVRQQAVADIIRQDPHVESLMSSVGAGGPTATENAGRVFIKLKPSAMRHETSADLIQSLRTKLNTVPGIRVYLQALQTISIGALSKSLYQFTIQDSDMTELNHWADVLLNEIKKIPGTEDVTSDLEFTGPQAVIDINRNKASTLGITAGEIENTLQYAYGSQQVSTIYTPIDSYQVILELLPQAQANPLELSRLYVHSNSGKTIPLSTMTSFTQGTGALTINHQGQLPSVTISFNLNSSTSIGNVVDAIQRLKAKLHMPDTLLSGFQGTAQVFQSSMQGLGLLIFFSILVIYVVLGILYESFIHPLTILSGLPAAGVGALLTLYLFGMELNFYSFIGIIILIGIVKKNAIMMIDFAIDAQRHQNKTPFEAIYQACLIRFRPIMMTSLAALMSALPIALAVGGSASSRRPLGVAVVGGLILSQLLTLYLTPVIYLYFEQLCHPAKNASSGSTKK